MSPSKPSWEMVEFSRFQYDFMWEEVAKYDQPELVRFLAAALGDADSWPCPFCLPPHAASCIGSVSLDRDGAPKSFRGDVAAVRKVASTLMFLGNVHDALGEAMTDRILGPEDTGRVYRCRRVGKFTVRYLLGDPEPFVVWVERSGVTRPRPPRVLPCHGLSIDLDQDEQIVNVAVCAQPLEWTSESGALPLEGSGYYACQVHGEQQKFLDPAFGGPFRVVVRRPTRTETPSSL